MNVKIEHLSLEKIKDSGQCFRVEEVGEYYRFITGDNILYIRELGSDYEVSCSKKEWENIWRPYFDVETDYERIRKTFLSADYPIIKEALDFGRGIRILKQDPFEVLITFIISQNKNMPAIARSVKMLSERFGHKIVTPLETVYTFPRPGELISATREDLRDCLVGYRDNYILDATESVVSNRLRLDKLESLSTRDLIEELKTIKGVGEKVASCIALFGYSRYDAVPKDIWIKRSIREDFLGEDIYKNFRDSAGILQQYIFYYKTKYKGE